MGAEKVVLQVLVSIAVVTMLLAVLSTSNYTAPSQLVRTWIWIRDGQIIWESFRHKVELSEVVHSLFHNLSNLASRLCQPSLVPCKNVVD